MDSILEFHVTCLHSKKIFKCSNALDIDGFKNSLEQQFEVKIKTIQVWSQKYNDWLDYEDEGLPQNDSKLKLMTESSEDLPKRNASTQPLTATNSANDCQSDSVNIIQLQDIDGNDPYPSFGQSRELPEPYSIPRLPPFVMKLIQEKTPIVFSRDNKSQIVKILFEDISGYNMYPKPTELERVCLTLVTKFPFLKDRRPTGKPYSTWYCSLLQKFRHERMKMTNLPSVLEMKERHKHNAKNRRSSQTNESPPTKTNRTSLMIKYGLAEDSDSVDAHISVMMKEISKSKLNTSLLEEKMSRTAGFRQTYAFDHSVIEVVEKFPLLKRVNQLIMELNRLQNLHPSAEIIATHHFQPLTKRILELIARKKKTGVQKHLINLEKQKLVLSEEKYEELELKTCFFVLPALFGEKMTLWAAQTEANGSTPSMVFSDEDFLNTCPEVQIEGVRFDVSSIITAVVSVFSGYYAFQLVYPVGLKRTLEYFQKYVFKINPGNISNAVATVANMLAA